MKTEIQIHNIYTLNTRATLSLPISQVFTSKLGLIPLTFRIASIPLKPFTAYVISLPGPADHRRISEISGTLITWSRLQYKCECFYLFVPPAAACVGFGWAEFIII